jgi:hypothetical protein
VLAELTFFHSRPIAPTRRIALGQRNLAGAAGVLLLAGVASRYGRMLSLDDEMAVEGLLASVVADAPITQPQMRHRLQNDTVGLTRSRHRLFDGGRFAFAEPAASPVQHVLAVIYSTAALEDNREQALRTLTAALAWQGPVDASFLDAIDGHDGLVGDSITWAQTVFGFDPDLDLNEREIRRRFRVLVSKAHPDVGGCSEGAAGRITALTEATRLLVASSTERP